MIFKSIFSTNSPSQCYFSSSNVFSITSATIRFWRFALLLLNGLSAAVVHVSILRFSFICQYPSLLISPSSSFKKRLGGPKYDIHIKNVLRIISSLLLVLISLAAEYLVNVSIKCRILYGLCLCSFKTKHSVSLNLFPRVNLTTGQRGGLLILRQTEQESQTSRIRSKNSLSLKTLLPLTKNINLF